MTILISRFNNLIPKKCKLILFSGSDVMDDNFHPTDMINLRSLHVIGKKDTLCLPKYSINLSKRYVSPNVIQHRWGHVIPHGLETRNKILNFLDNTVVFENVKYDIVELSEDDDIFQNIEGKTIKSLRRLKLPN